MNQFTLLLGSATMIVLGIFLVAVQVENIKGFDCDLVVGGLVLFVIAISVYPDDEKPI